LIAASAFLVDAAAAQTPDRPIEKVRVTYQATGDCPTSESFMAQVRARVGTAWEAPANELARTIDVRVTGGAEKSIARIDFVDENAQPITRVVTASSCDEVVTGIALVTALAIESRIAEAVGKSEPASPSSNEPAPAPSATESSPAEAKPKTPSSSPPPTARPREAPSPPPYYDFGGGVIAASGALPRVAVGPRAFLGFGWTHGPDVRLGADFLRTAAVDTVVSGRSYSSTFRLILARASACPFAFGDTVRILPCGGVEIGQLLGEGIDSNAQANGLSVSGTEKGLLWLAPFLGVRGDVGWNVFFAEVELSLAFAVSGGGSNFVFQTKTASGGVVDDTVHTVSPVTPGGALTLGLRL
jgi:hypothetical protein